jgi:hypothetical protein
MLLGAGPIVTGPRFVGPATSVVAMLSHGETEEEEEEESGYGRGAGQ